MIAANEDIYEEKPYELKGGSKILAIKVHSFRSSDENS